MPRKVKDPGSLLSLASINLMAYKIFKRLGLGGPKPTRMTLQLADNNIRHFRGVIEDVLVKVDWFVFHTDFVILDLKDDVEIPLILRRPFLATSQALINVNDRKLELITRDEKARFRLLNAIKHSPDFDDLCCCADVIDDVVNERAREMTQVNSLEAIFGEE